MPKNAAIAISYEGNVLQQYNKIHPFFFSGENRYFSSGNMLSLFDCGGINAGLSICYDLRFPEIFRALAARVHIIVTIANWPDSRIEHWKILLKARAVENQVFMVGVNRTGTDGNNLFYSESSGIFDPTGNEIPYLIREGVLSIYDIEPSVVSLTRSKFPFLQDRKPDLYKSIL